MPGTAGYWCRRRRGTTSALLYHRVQSPDAYAFLTRGGLPCTSEAEFAGDMDLLQRFGVTFVTFADLRREDEAPADQTRVIICFDDGLRDNYEVALPILRARGIPRDSLPEFGHGRERNPTSSPSINCIGSRAMRRPEHDSWRS